MKKKLRLTTVLMIVFGLMFLISAWNVFAILRDNEEDKAAFESLAQMVETAQPGLSEAGGAGKNEAGIEEGTEAGEAADAPPETESPYRELKEQNPEFFGWISIEGTKLNYPVMHTPEDPEYYLHRNFDGKSSYSGVPFLDGECFSGCGNYLIYGHNMKSGTMFKPLLAYEKKEYWEKHPTLRFDTMEGLGEYEVAAAFFTEIYPESREGVFRYYEYKDLRDEAVFEEFVSQAKEAALYDTGVSPAYGDELLTLSTCSYHTKEGRFVVIARKK